MWDSTFDFSLKKIHENDSYTIIRIHGTNESKTVNVLIDKSSSYGFCDNSCSVNLDPYNIKSITELKNNENGKVSVDIRMGELHTHRITFNRVGDAVTISIRESEYKIPISITLTINEFDMLLGNALMYFEMSLYDDDEPVVTIDEVVNVEFDDEKIQHNFNNAIYDWLAGDELGTMMYKDEELRFDILHCNIQIDPPESLGKGYIVTIEDPTSNRYSIFRVFLGKDCERVIEFYLEDVG